MGLETLSGLALCGVGIITLVMFAIIERYDSKGLIALITEHSRPSLAVWLLSNAAFLFAPRTTINAIGLLIERKLHDPHEAD